MSVWSVTAGPNADLKAPPLQIVKGDRVEWSVTLPDYAAPTYYLYYAFVMSGVDSIRIGGSASSEVTDADQNGGWECYLPGQINATPAEPETAFMTPGIYAWREHVRTNSPVEGGGRITLREGHMEVLPNYASDDYDTSGYDHRTFVKKALDALESVITSKVAKDRVNFMIGNRSISHMGSDEIMRWHAHFQMLWRAEVRRERAARGLRSSNTIKMRL